VAPARSNADSGQKKKEKYAPPRLVAYGKLQDLTRGGGRRGADVAGPNTMMCWVAEAVYGRDDLRTHLLRAWLVGPYLQTRLGAVVVAAYRTFGRPVAAIARRSAWVKGVLRPVLDGGVRRAQRHYLGN